MIGLKDVISHNRSLIRNNNWLRYILPKKLGRKIKIIKHKHYQDMIGYTVLEHNNMGVVYCPLVNKAGVLFVINFNHIEFVTEQNQKIIPKKSNIIELMV